MLNVNQFRELIIKPVLLKLDMYSQAAENLVLGTATQESRITYLKQIGGGPALGVFQMEPATYYDLWKYLEREPAIAQSIRDIAGAKHRSSVVPPSEMVGNLNYAVAMCRIHYYRRPEPLPDADDLNGLANYWKKFYNTPLGAGTVDEFIGNYKI